MSAIALRRSSVRLGDPLPGKDPRLPPTHSLLPDEFEDFTERVLSAHRFCPGAARRVTRVERWGRRGDFQDGIDFEGEFSDGKTAAWQCKRQDKLTPADVRKAVRVCTFKADEYYLVFSGEASRNARNEIKKFPRWQLLDRRSLGRVLNDVPLHKRRDVLDETWDRRTRQFLLNLPGADAFLSLDAFAADRADQSVLLNDCGPRIGRDAELGALRTALDRDSDWPNLIAVAGPGGRGKTRLITEALDEFQQTNPQVPVICLFPGRIVDQAAIDELPHTPAVIVVDDAHRDPAALAPLLSYARMTEGTQLVLGTRTSGVGAVQAEIVSARYAPGQVETISIGDLSLRDARALVTSLADDLDLSLATREHFATQAVDSPHVAVIGLNLIRRDELTAPLVVDDALRQQVLARYQEVATGDIDGVASRTVRRVLAVYAALGPVDDTDAELREDIAQFVGLELDDLLRLCHGLHDRGTLVTRSDLTRVVPDVLADDILETEATTGRHATGFVQRLWDAFGSPYDDRVVVTLAELDWRLQCRGRPSIIGPIWASVADRLRSADGIDLHRALRGLRSLATLLPGPFLTVLEELRVRLQQENAAVDGAKGQGDDQQDVLWLLPELYGQCAANEPEALETVLNALWALYRNDIRPPNQYPGHPIRVIEDRLACIGDMIDPTYPLRIVAWADKQLIRGAEPANKTPMSIIRPLLAKDITRTVAETRRRISIRPYAVSATWARPVRDAIRAMLVREAGGTNLRRAGEAVRLLGTALRQPTGSVGRTVTLEEVLGWEDDDLATLADLETASTTTASSVIRRLIRHEIAWTAEHARSMRVRHAALTLVTSLDEGNDDLAEALLSAHRGLPTRRGVPVPALGDLQAADAARVAHEAGLPHDALDAERNERIRLAVEERTRMREQHVARVVAELAAVGVPPMVETLRTCAAEIDSAATTPPTLWGFWRQLASSRPELVPEVIQTAARGPASALDKNLDQLLDAWAAHDSTGLLAWLADEPNFRLGIRLAVANAFANFGWTDLGAPFVELHRRGLAATEPDLRDRYVMGSHRLLAAEPAATTRLLLDGTPSPFALKSALECACGYDGLVWGRDLSKKDAAAILDLINHAGWDDYTVQQIAAGIALAHPVLVLNKLQALSDSGGRLPTDVDGFADAFGRNAEALTRWIVDRIDRGEAESSSAVVSIAVAGAMTTAHARHLSDFVEQRGGTSPVAMVSALEDLRGWPLQHPGLARRLLTQARLLDDSTATRLLADIARAVTLSSWAYTNGQSAELNRTLAAATQAAATETDSDLKASFKAAEAWASHHAEQLLTEMAEDDD